MTFPRHAANVTFPDGSVLRTSVDVRRTRSVDLELVVNALWDSELEPQHVWDRATSNSARNFIALLRQRAFEVPMQLVKRFMGDQIVRGTIANPVLQPQYVMILDQCFFDVLLRQALALASNMYAPPWSNKSKSHLIAAHYLLKLAEGTSYMYGPPSSTR